MKLSFVISVPMVLGLVTACSSSDTPHPKSTAITSHEPDATLADSNPDQMTCADWAITEATDRKFAAAHFASEYHDPQPVQDLTTLTSIITTTCSSYGSDETPRHIAQVSIVSVYSS